MVDDRLAIMVGGILLVLTPCLAQTNAMVSFNIYIDNNSPNYSFFNGLSMIDDINDEFHCYAQWFDDSGPSFLYQYFFEWDLTGAAKNDTAQEFSNGWSNITKTFNSADEGKEVNYRFHASDLMGNLNATYYKTLVIASLPPNYSKLSQDNGTPIKGSLVNISSYWFDNFEVDSVYLQTNETGEWHDNGSPVDIDVQEGWANFTIDTAGMNSSPYYWRLKGFDEIGNSNTTLEQYFTVN